MFNLFSRDQQQSLVGQVLNKQYKLKDRIGEGAFGDVYCAQQILLERDVAIKVLKATWPDKKTKSQGLANFDVEAKLTCQVHHPNAVTVFDYGIYNKNLLYLVMEFIDGQPLSSILRKNKKRLELPRIYNIIKQICAALSQAHNLGIVHCDLKPDNIMVSVSEQGDDWVKVLDFGIAKIISLDSQEDNVVCGTPPYMSPEQCEAKLIDRRSDIYSLGIILYEMLSHQHHPFPNIDNPFQYLYQHINVTPIALTHANYSCRVSEEINRVVMRCLEKQPDQRYASVIELLSDLKKAFFGIPKKNNIPHSQYNIIAMDDMLDAYDLANTQFKQGNYASAFEQLHNLIERGVSDPQLIYLAILSLARSGSYDLAMRYWQRYEDIMPETEDNLALKARLLKDQYKHAEIPLKQSLGRQARDEYLKISQVTQGYYPLINAATLSFWLGDVTQAQALAKQTLSLCETEPTHYWSLVTQAEAHLILNNPIDAATLLQKAGSLINLNLSDLSSTYQQLKLICQTANINTKLLQPIKPPEIAHYTGHMINGMGKSLGIDPDDEPLLRKQANEYLAKKNIAIAYGALANGADIIFAEAILAREAKLHIILPFSQVQFENISVKPAGTRWLQRFQRILTKASSIRILSNVVATDLTLLFKLNTEYAIGLTVLHAKQLQTDAVQIAMYNGLKTDRIAGTAADIQCWGKLNYESLIITTPSPRQSISPIPQPSVDHTLKEQNYQVFIVARIHHYSKMSDADLPLFMQACVARFNDDIMPYLDHQASVEIWGDSWLLTLNDVSCAAELCTKVTQKLMLEAKQSDHAIGLQIFIHAGLVFHDTHNMFGKERFYGEHILKTSKMFLNMPVNSIYVSEEFAARLIVNAPESYRYCYAGQQVLPENTGQFRLYNIQAL